jgi:hypothetical protein
VIPKQRMAFAGDSLLTSPLDYPVCLFIFGLAVDRLITGPVQTQSAIIEERGKSLPEGRLLLGIRATREKKEVAAKQKVVSQLLDPDLDPGQRFARGVLDQDRGVALAMPLDAGLSGLEDFRVCRRFFFRGPGRSTEQESGRSGAGAEERASIHAPEQTAFCRFDQSKVPRAGCRASGVKGRRTAGSAYCGGAASLPVMPWPEAAPELTPVVPRPGL